jgi:hypothetical protein
MTELLKEKIVTILDSSMKISDEFFSNYSKIDLKQIKKNQVESIKFFTKMQRTWIETSKPIIHPFFIEKVEDFNDVWERLFNTWGEN